MMKTSTKNHLENQPARKEMQQHIQERKHHKISQISFILMLHFFSFHHRISNTPKPKQFQIVKLWSFWRIIVHQVTISFFNSQKSLCSISHPLFLVAKWRKFAQKKKKKTLPVSPHRNIFETLNRDFSPSGHMGFLIGPFLFIRVTESSSCCFDLKELLWI
jgi:hypothetical protein